MKKLLYSAESPFGRYKVMNTTYNDRPARVLYGSRGSPQSGVALDDNPELLFDYNQRFLELIMSHHPRTLLVIGGGAFMLPTGVFHRFPDITIDVVEIDPLLVDISREYFNLPDNERLRVHVGDGAAFIANSKTRYDMIIVDAFSGFTIPSQLIEGEILKEYKRHLTRKGVLAINFISEYKPRRFRLAHQLLASFGEVFSWRALYQADIHYPKGFEQNLLLVAGHQPQHFEYLHSSELEQYET